MRAVGGFLDDVGAGLLRWPWRFGGQPWVLAADLYLALAGWSHTAIRSALVRLEAECLLEGDGENRAKNAKTLRLTAAGVAAAVQKPPRDRALVLAELLALADDNPDLGGRLATYLADGSDDAEGGAA